MAKEKTEKEKKRKPKQRGNGEGSIYKRSDERWCGAITVGRKEDGSLKKRVLYGKTRNEVAEKMNKELNALATGNYVDPNNITVGEWVKIWLFEYKKPSVKPTTFRHYEELARNHIIKPLGYIKLRDLKSDQVQRLYKKLLKTESNPGGLSPSTIKDLNAILKDTLNKAVSKKLITENIAKDLTLPRVPQAGIKVFTVDEQMKFLKAIENSRLKALYILALSTGMRKGEIIALRWNNVDLDNGLIHVKQTASRVKIFDENKTSKTEIIFQEPKTASGRRTITISASIVEELKQHKEKQLLENELKGKKFKDDDLVFCSRRGNVISSPNLNRDFRKILNSIELDSTFHALRHTYATRLLEANEHPKVVQVLLGHSNVSLTLNTYSHVMPQMKTDAAAKIDYLFKKNSDDNNSKNHNDK